MTQVETCCLLFWPEARASHENSCHEEMNCLLNYQSNKLCEKNEGNQCTNYLAELGSRQIQILPVCTRF